MIAIRLSAANLREILLRATREIEKERPLRLCFVPRQGGCLYYGGVHGHVRRACSSFCLPACLLLTRVSYV